MRRFGERVKRDIRYTDRPGAYAVLARDGALLVTHQSRPLREFQLPGGGIDPGESPLRALHREVLEETGWRIDVMRRLGAFQRYAYLPDYDIWARKVCHIFLARPVRRLGPPTEPGHRAVWMLPGEAARRLGNAGDRHFVATLLGEL